MEIKKYHLVHSWLYRNFSAEKKYCKKCESGENLEFALIRGKTHKKERKNYIILCHECHLAYDLANKCKKCGKRCKYSYCGHCNGSVRSHNNSLKEWKKLYPKGTMVCLMCRRITKLKFRGRRLKKYCSTTCRVNHFFKRHDINPSKYTQGKVRVS